MDNDNRNIIEFEGQFLRMVRRGRWEFVQRKNISGVVGIIPVTDEGQLVLVEQFRPPVNKRVIELPAGLAGDITGQEHEAFETAARRELLEETGFDAEKIEYAFEGGVSVGLCDEVLTFYKATGLKKIGSGGGDATEDIKVHIVPIEGIKQWLEQKRQEDFLIDIKIYAGLNFVI